MYSKLDLEMLLLKGSAIYFHGMPIYKVTLGEMTELGYESMNRIVHTLCMNDAETKNLIKEDIEDATFYFLYVSCLAEKQKITDGDIDTNDENAMSGLIYPDLMLFLSTLFKEDVDIKEDYGFVVGNKMVINENNYDEFRKYLKLKFCLNDIEEFDDENPADDRAKALLERRKELREKIKDKKSNQSDGGDGINISDLISIFAQAEYMVLQDVYEKYDIYQFNNQFNRLKIMDDFHVNIQTLLAGAKNEDVKLKHWLSKINVKED